MFRTKALAVSTSLFLTHLTFAQSRETVSQAIEWAGITSNIKTSKHISLIAEGQFRFARTFEPMQFQVRAAVDIHVSKKFSFVPLGYVYTYNPTYGKQPNTFVNNEHRLWQQVMFKHKAGRVQLSHRVRTEQRYIQVHVNNNGEILNQGYDFFAHRFRYRIMANIPFSGTSIEPKHFYASVYNEVFVSRGPKVTYHDPDQNRLFVGAGYQASKNVSFQFGLLYQMLVKANGAKQENNVGLQVGCMYNVDMSNAK